MMPHAKTILLLLLSLAVPAATGAQTAQQPPIGQVIVGTFSFHQRIIIRLPREARRKGRAAPDEVDEWRTKKAPHCVRTIDISGALGLRDDSVDLATNRGDRLRAMVGQNCPALLFYSGFYLKQNPDGKICAGRDAIYSRAGEACPILGFYRLLPQR